MNLLKNVKIDQILGYYAAGVTAEKSDIVDMAGYEGVMFVFALGTIIEAGVLNCYVNGNSTNATGGTKLAGAIAHTVTAADALLAKSAIVIDVYRPDPTLYRYLEAVIDPDTQNAVILGITAIRYSGRVKPDANAALLAAAQLVSPDAAA